VNLLFTGIIEELGLVKNISLKPQSAVLTIEAHKVLEGTKIGDSIAVCGVCLTVVSLTPNSFTVDVMAETLNKTILKDLKVNSPVNLERALRLSSRLGGHLVTGHVDGIGTIRNIVPRGIANIFEIAVPPELLTLILPKGSVAVDGISLTVVDVGSDHFSVSIIPHTFRETTLGVKKKGDRVNIETDIIGKYVAKLMRVNEAKEQKPAGSTLTLEFLAKHGFV